MGGERIVCRPASEPESERLVAEPGPLTVVYADDDLVVLDKSAGVAMHPGAGRPAGTLANFLLNRYPEMATVGSPRRPGIVHRLDLDTTGAVVVARTDAAYRRLSRAFAERRVDKVYLAVCYGAPDPVEGRFDRPIGRHPRRRTEMTVRPDGRAAHTEYRLLATHGGVSVLRLALGTGRTHQIRVHLKAAGHPLVGDPTYGEARWKSLPAASRAPLREFPRPALHAWRLGFEHPASGEKVTFEVAPPDDLRRLWRQHAGVELPLERTDRG
ncbi:MAG: RluA family pseudouridine synthase [Thermoanaerobaculia bacterium]|nr:RluA family pseudouridine synthase [Thermoanaerobaculia bacterium]